MRSVLIGLLFFSFLVSASEAGPRGSPPWHRQSHTLKIAVGIIPQQGYHPFGSDVLLRFGRTYWPLSKFGDCFVELRAPDGTTARSVANAYKGASLAWDGKKHSAACYGDIWQANAFWYAR